MSFGSLGFLSPLILVALLGLPLIWWLLRATPPAPTRVRFPAFILLNKINNQEETPDRTPWWLLLLRLFLAACIIIGLAGPILNSPEVAENDGPIVLIVDNSYAAAPGWRLRETAINRAAEQARQSNRPLFAITTTPPYPVGTPSLFGPLEPEDLRSLSDQLRPVPFAADRRLSTQMLLQLDERLALPEGAAKTTNNQPNFIWLGDNHSAFDKTNDQIFLDALKQRGPVTLLTDQTRPVFAVHKASAEDITSYALDPDNETTRSPTLEGGNDNRADLPAPISSSNNLNANLNTLYFTVRRLEGRGTWDGEIVALARDGRELDRAPVQFGNGETKTVSQINLPIALQNLLASVRIETVRSSAAVWLADARDRRALIGLQHLEEDQTSTLLSGNHYIHQALSPFAQFQYGDISALVEADVSVIILNDVGRMREKDVSELTNWVKKGGVLVRFSGPNLADAALESQPPLLPIELRKGERAFGGALTWDTPQPLGEFSSDGPFSDLIVPDDIFVRQQVLAQPGGITSERTWASLQDGTPLVTGNTNGNGLIVLFHITATPIWSDLPLSEVFIDMLRKLTFLSALAPESLDDTLNDQNQTRYAPLRILDGYGQLQTPATTLSGITIVEASAAATPLSPPGLYGANETPLTINTVSAQTSFKNLSLNAITAAPYTEKSPNYLWVYFFIIALFAFLVDMIASLYLAGKLTQRKNTVRNKLTNSKLAATIGFIILAFTASIVIHPVKTSAQTTANEKTSKPLDPPIDERIIDATLKTRFAYVITGNKKTDSTSEIGLTALSQELSRRTTVSPAAPVGIDLYNDDFSVYPLLYWPIEANAETLPDIVLSQVENYMRLGGLIIFDTKDEERVLSGRETPEAANLRRLLSRINVPPLVQAISTHVFYRSYYLLPELRGRTGFHPVWVARTSSVNDGVTSLIIGGRDWAGAWARSSEGIPLKPIVNNQYNNGERAREMAYRTGINIAMVAFTGNYKTDQVHAKILLERLGETSP